MKDVLISLLAGSLLALPAQAASFDCKNASTRVEHIICDTPGISELDDEMTAGYQKVLKNKAQWEKVRTQQKVWLEERNACTNQDCVRALYLARIQELENAALLFPGKNLLGMAEASEKPSFENEADKLEFMRHIVGKRQFKLFLKQDSYCRRFFGDFLSGSNMQAVAPNARINDSNDPRLKKWLKCAESDPPVFLDEDATGAPGDAVLEQGGPPYRLYELELDGDLNDGKENVVYADVWKLKPGEVSGKGGYYWIDLTQCIVRGMVPLDSAKHLLRPNLYNLSALVNYGNEYLVVELTPIWTKPYYRMSVLSIGDERSGDKHACFWYENGGK